MKLTDLNLICLEGVLEHLELGDMLSAASANKRLNRAACFVYGQEYREKMVDMKSARLLENRLYKISKDSIEVKDLRSSLQMLRCFGQLINELKCGYKAGTYFLSYVNEYCSGYLSKLTLVEIPEDHLNAFVKPFAKVEDVSIDNCHFNVGTYWLKDTFPQMRTLQFNIDRPYYQLTENEYFAHHFPHLENLEIRIRRVASGDPSQAIENFKTMFRLNQQLKTFRCNVYKLRRIFDAEFFRSIIEHIQNLEALEITGDRSFYDNFNGNALHLRSVKHFRFNLLNHPLQNGIPFLFDNLVSVSKPLSSHIDYYLRDVDEIQFIDFLRKHPMIEKLTFEHGIAQHISRTNVSELEKLCPFLKEIVIVRGDSYSTDGVLAVIEFIQVIKSVKVLTLHFCGAIENLIERLHDNWTLKKQEHRIDFGKNHRTITLERLD